MRRQLLINEAARLDLLADDLRLIAEGLAPTAEMLGDAPLLDQFTLASRPVPCLIGYQTGHPTVKGKLVATSGLWVTAADHSWVRTQSRFYRLGRPKGLPDHA